MLEKPSKPYKLNGTAQSKFKTANNNELQLIEIEIWFKN